MNEHNRGVEPKVGATIKRIRERKGLSLFDLAQKSGFSTALLSQIENHLISPSLGALTILSRALEVDIGTLLGHEGKAPFCVTRSSQGQEIFRFASTEGVKYGYSYESLAHDKKNRRMEPFIVTLEPPTVPDLAARTHDGEEFLYVLEGKMKVTLGDHTDVLEPGDSIYYDSSIPHRVECVGKSAKLLAVIYTPSG